MTPDSEPEYLPDVPEKKTERVPVSLVIWLAILIATYAIPSLFAVQGRSAKIARESGITTSSFQELAQAEYATRLALVPALNEQKGLKKKTTKEVSYVQSAADKYRSLATTKKGVTSARKALILDHLQKKTLDDSFLTGVLAVNLAGRKEKPGNIETEIALWRSLYGKDAARNFDRRDTENIIGRIKTWQLGLLQEPLIADVYGLAGNTTEANQVRKAVESKALGEALRIFLTVGLLIVAGLIGVVFLILAFSAWLGKNGSMIGRVLQEPSDKALPFFAGLDVFLAYLAISRGVGLFAGIVPGLDTVSPVYLSALIYVGTGILATIYLLIKRSTGHWTLESLGIRTHRITDVFYGIAGYCAVLPITFLLGALNNALFKTKESSLTPNPVLPMIAGEGSSVGRVILFCLVAIAAPLFEELFFRGILYSALKQRFPVVASVIISAACFAVVHPMGDWIPIFGLGCMLATMRELRQSLVPGIVMHFCQNSLAFVMMSSLFTQ